MVSSVGIQVLRAWRKAFGVVLDECRDAAELSQEGLTEASGLNRKFISSLENAHQEPGLSTIVKAARATRVSVTEMLRRAERLAEPDAIRESLAEHAQAKISLGMVTCSRCKAVYEMHVRRVEAHRSRKLKCRFCKEPLASWEAPVLLIYEVRRWPPKVWPKK